MEQIAQIRAKSAMLRRAAATITRGTQSKLRGKLYFKVQDGKGNNTVQKVRLGIKENNLL